MVWEVLERAAVAVERGDDERVAGGEEGVHAFMPVIFELQFGTT